MASPVRTLTVNFVGKTKDLDKAFKRVSKGSSLMSDRMVRAASIGMGAFAGIGAAVTGAVMTLKPMVAAAADVGESLSKNRTLFGDAASAAERFAETSAESFGISRREALEAVGVFGSLAHAMGMPQAEGVDLSVTMTKLAADMASFNNASIDETLTALQAGLRGEAEPLRRFGVLLDAATLKAKALQEGLIENEKEALTPQVKALAAYRLILEQTAIQQGDFTRTSDGLTNQQKMLAATFDDIKVAIGEGLLPVVTDVVTAFNEELLPSVKAFWEDPSVASAAREGGRIYWRLWGDGVEEAADADAEGGRGFWVRVFTPPAFVVAGFAKLGFDAIKAFREGLQAEEIAQGIQAAFDRAGEQLDIDWEEFFNLESAFDSQDFTVEPGTNVVVDPEMHSGAWGWPPDTGFVDPFGGNTPGVGTFGGGIFGDDFSLDDFSNSLDEALADSMAEIATMNDALAEAVAGQAEVDALFDDLMAEVEELRLAAMGEGDITGTGPGLAEVGGASPFGSPPAASTGPTADELTDVASFLSGGGVQEFFGPGGMGGPPNTQVNVTINAPAVTGKEVIDAMADAVRIGGPFERQWVGR